MMKLMNKKMGKNEKGFTLAELLIVVAIVAVLVAISIPMFNSKLEQAREATDVANMRAAKAAAVVSYTNGDIVVDTVYAYDADDGVLLDTGEKPKNGYGKGTETNAGTTYSDYDPGDGKYKDGYITVEVKEDDGKETVELKWVPKSGS